jgi:hypothetical protein
MHFKYENSWEVGKNWQDSIYLHFVMHNMKKQNLDQRTSGKGKGEKKKTWLMLRSSKGGITWFGGLCRRSLSSGVATARSRRFHIQYSTGHRKLVWWMFLRKPSQAEASDSAWRRLWREPFSSTAMVGRRSTLAQEQFSRTEGLATVILWRRNDVFFACEMRRSLKFSPHRKIPSTIMLSAGGHINNATL